jgi:S1-C subfamily serine protease
MAVSADWRLVASVPGEQRYIDVGTLQRDGSLAKAWVQRTYDTTQEFEAGRIYFQSDLTMTFFDCDKRMSLRGGFTLYSEPHLGGRPVLAVPDVESSWRDVAPETVGEAQLELACSFAAVGSNPKPSVAATRSSGTGFRVDSKGTVITSNHVVEGAKKITARCGQGEPKAATAIASSRVTDIAILRVEPDAAVYLPLASARSTASGTQVFTFGYPVADLLGGEPKFTDGAVSSMSGIGGEQTFMQISIPIQPGSSGGPVVNDHGQVVGIVAAAALEPFLRNTGTLPQNVNWAVKAEYAAVMFDPPPALPPASSRQEAIEWTRRAVCYIEAE